MPRVLCLGEILVDQIARESGVTSEQVNAWTPYAGGAPANVACGLSKLGTSAGFIGCVGQDSVGKGLVQLLKREGVDTTGVQIHPTAPTREVYVTRSADGDRAFVRFSGNANTVFADTLLLADALPVSLFEAADFLVLGTLGLAKENTSKAIARALKFAEENYIRIVVDLNWRPIFWSDPEPAPTLIRALLEHADFLKLSEEEAEWLFGTTNPTEIVQTLDHLEGAMVTYGDRGCHYYIDEQQGEQSAFAVETVDTTGAGDAFLAGFIHQLCQHSLADLQDPEHVRQIIAYASAAGAIATTGMGAIASQPTDAAVREFLATH